LPIARTSPLIIGHRGASAVAPENTLAAFARAFDDGADGIELDVRLARDGLPVVIHDANLRHTSGRKAKVGNLTSARLSEIDVGSWFNRAHHRFARLQYSRQTVPALDDVFRLLRNQSRKDFVVYIEMKTCRTPSLNAALARAVVEATSRHELHKQTVVISFNLAAVAKIKELDASIRTGALFGPRQRAIRSVKTIVEAALTSGASEILLHRLIATPRMVGRARASDLYPVVWTVDDPKWLGRASRCGIHALITNNPARMIEAT